MATLTNILVQLLVALLGIYIPKGTAAYQKWSALNDELAQNKKRADEYDKVVDNPNSTREERERAEDSIGS